MQWSLVEGKVLAADESVLQAGSAEDPQLLVQLAVRERRRVARRVLLLQPGQFLVRTPASPVGFCCCCCLCLPDSHVILGDEKVCMERERRND